MINSHTDPDRRRILKVFASLGITGPLALDLAAQARARSSVEILKNAEAIRGEEFSEDRLEVINTALQRNLDEFQNVRDFELDDLIEPAPIFVSTRHAAPAIAVRGRSKEEATHGQL